MMRISIFYFKFNLERKNIIYMLLVSLFISTVLGFMKEAVSFKLHWSDLLHQKAIGADYMPLLRYIANEKEVGFISDMSREEYVVNLYQSFNVLSPIIIRENHALLFTIGLFRSSRSIKRAENKYRIRLIAKSSGGIYLFKKL